MFPSIVIKQFLIAWSFQRVCFSDALFSQHKAKTQEIYPLRQCSNDCQGFLGTGTCSKLRHDLTMVHYYSIVNTGSKIQRISLNSSLLCRSQICCIHTVPLYCACVLDAFTGSSLPSPLPMSSAVLLCHHVAVPSVPEHFFTLCSIL